MHIQKAISPRHIWADFHRRPREIISTRLSVKIVHNYRGRTPLLDSIAINALENVAVVKLDN
jgi:hypothetical protein